MAWVKLDDRFYEHPKVMRLSARALRLHVFALCFAARNETNGHIPEAAIKRLMGGPKQAAELVDAGLWEVNAVQSKNGSHDWTIHDYLKYNPSARQLEQRRRDAKRRMAQIRGGS